MCFPVFKMVNGKWELHAVYTDHGKLMSEWGTKYDYPAYCWEPWPVDVPFGEVQ